MVASHAALRGIRLIPHPHPSHASSVTGGVPFRRTYIPPSDEDDPAKAKYLDEIAAKRKAAKQKQDE